MIVDTHRDRHTDMLITILRSLIGDGVITAEYTLNSIASRGKNNSVYSSVNEIS